MTTSREGLQSRMYKGLQPFTEGDADLFFGREDERDRLVYSLQSSRLTVVYGARQVGKTSLLRAGVTSRLRRKLRKQWSSSPEAAVVVFNKWSSTELLTELSTAIEKELERMGISHLRFPDLQEKSFLDRCTSWLKCIGEANGSGGELFLLLDQFEDYLLLHPNLDTDHESFDMEFSRIISTRGLAVNWLIAIRDDHLAGLDRYRSSIPNIYSSLIRLEDLTKKQAKEAIQGPVYKLYNVRHAENKIGIEAALVKAVLDSIRLKRGFETPSSGDSPDVSDARFDAGGLQLAMKAVWNCERSQGSQTLRYNTFEKELGGISGITRHHVDDRASLLSARERHLSARIFDHLLTPGGIGVAYQLSDLSSRVGVTESELRELVSKLERERIVVASASGNSPGSLRYEMAQRVLTPAIIDLVQNYFIEKAGEEKRLASEIQKASQLFFEKSQVDALKKLIDACESWSTGAKNLLVSDDLQIDLRNALIRVLDNLTQKGQLGGYRGAVSSVTYTPDGGAIVTGAEDGSVCVWNSRHFGGGPVVQTGKHKTWIWTLRTSTDGKWIATGSDDGTVGLWIRTSTGLNYHRSISVSDGSGTPPLVRGLSFSSKAPLLAIAATDGWVRLWHLLEEKVVHEFRASSVAVRCVEFHPEELTIATGADDGTIAFWDLAGKPLKNHRDSEDWGFRHNSPVWEIRFDPAGQRLASCSEDHSIKLWDVKEGREERTLIGHTCWVLDIAFSSDGKLLGSASEDGTARLWDREGNQVEVCVHGAPVNGICFSPDDRSLATAAADCKVRVWSVSQRRGPKSSRQLIHPGKAILLDVSFSSDGKSLATGATDNQVQIWNQDGYLNRCLSGHNGWIMCVVFHPVIASVLATGSIDGTARIWNLLEGSSLRFAPEDGPVWSVAFSPDGTHLATGSGGGKICVWDLREQQNRPIHCFSSDHGSVWSIRFSPDGKWITAGCQDGSIEVRDVAGQRKMSLTGTHEGQILSLSFCPGSSLLASSSSEGRICIWDFATRDVKWCHNLDAPIWSVSFSPNGEMVASGSVDRSVCLWNLVGDKVAGFSAQGPIRGLAFSRDGQWLAGSCSDGIVRLWSTSNEDLYSLLARAKEEWEGLRPLLWTSEATPEQSVIRVHQARLK